MFKSIKKNKFESGFIVSVFIIFITLIIYYILNAIDLGEFSIIIALIFSISTAWASYYYSDKIVLRMNNARPATKEENLKLVNILESLIVSSGLNTMPKLYIVEDNQPNAFATGRNLSNSVICVTTGLLNTLDYYELEGVLAHELAHIKNYDILLSAIVTVMVGFVVMLSDTMSRTFFYRRNRKSDDDNKLNGIIMLLGLICLVLSPIFGKLMQLAISRKREFMADGTAVEFTRNPDGLISALQKLDSYSSELSTANSATAHMYIVNPFKNVKQNSSSLLSTHPSIEDRIANLKNLSI